MSPASSDPADDDLREHRARLRQKFARGGANALHDYELLELLLTHAIPRRDVKPLAKALLARFGSLDAALSATPAELAAVPGMGEVSAGLLHLVHALHAARLGERLRQLPTLDSSAAVVDFARAELAGRPHEAVLALYLDTRNRLLEHQIVCEGTVDNVVIYPRRILEAALACRAAGLILVHNHPSGDCTPSAADDQLTQALTTAAAALDVLLLDHLIVGRHQHYSFAEHGRVSR